jgi:hypothetical protein
MGGDQSAQVQKTPQGIGDEMRPKGARMTAKLLVDLCEDGLPASLVPIDFKPAVGIEEIRVQTHGPLGVILRHDQIRHRGRNPG